MRAGRAVREKGWAKENGTGPDAEGKGGEGGLGCLGWLGPVGFGSLGWVVFLVSGLGWVFFFSFPFLILIQTKLNLFEFKF